EWRAAGVDRYDPHSLRCRAGWSRSAPTPALAAPQWLPTAGGRPALTPPNSTPGAVPPNPDDRKSKARLAACPCPPNCHPGRTTRHARFGCHYQSPERIAEDWSSLSSRTSRRFRQAIARPPEPCIILRLTLPAGFIPTEGFLAKGLEECQLR